MFPHSTIEKIKAKCTEYGVPWQFAVAVAWHESAGGDFTQNVRGDQLPAILPEAHVFWRNLPQELRKRAGAMGLAHCKWDRKWYNRKFGNNMARRYEVHKQMMDLHFDAGVCAASYGAFQILGENWKSLGYTTAREFYAIMMNDGFLGQIDAFLRFVKRNHLVDEMERLDFRGFARGYNGPQYEKNRYHTEIRHAYAAVASSMGMSEAGPAPMGTGAHVASYAHIRMGHSGDRVADLQRQLKKLGHLSGDIDRDFGPMTRSAVKAFQRSAGLTADGIVGPATTSALDKAITAHNRKARSVEKRATLWQRIVAFFTP